MLEHLSEQQGTGDITLFFSTGSAALPQGLRAAELRHNTRWRVGVADGPRHAVRGGLDRGRFPYARYFKFNTYRFENNTFVAIAGSSLPGYDIEPDAGSGNPFRLGADRLV